MTLRMTTYWCSVIEADYASVMPIYQAEHPDRAVEIEVFEHSGEENEVHEAKIVLSRKDALDLATRLINRVMHDTWEGIKDSDAL